MDFGDAPTSAHCHEPYCDIVSILASGGSKGGRYERVPPGPKFVQFHAVFGKIRPNSMLAPPLGLAPLLWESLDPSLLALV